MPTSSCGFLPFTLEPPKASSSNSPSYQEGICHMHFLPSFLRRTLLFLFLWAIVAEELEIARREIHWKVIKFLSSSHTLCIVQTRERGF